MEPPRQSFELSVVVLRLVVELSMVGGGVDAVVLVAVTETVVAVKVWVGVADVVAVAVDEALVFVAVRVSHAHTVLFAWVAGISLSSVHVARQVQYPVDSTYVMKLPQRFLQKFRHLSMVGLYASPSHPTTSLPQRSPPAAVSDSK